MAKNNGYRRFLMEFEIMISFSIKDIEDTLLRATIIACRNLGYDGTSQLAIDLFKEGNNGNKSYFCCLRTPQIVAYLRADVVTGIIHFTSHSEVEKSELDKERIKKAVTACFPSA